MGMIAAALISVALGSGVAYLGAVCVTTALLHRSVEAQAFFVNLLADLHWSGYAILMLIGVGIALVSVIQLVLWPRGRVWRWLARRIS